MGRKPYPKSTQEVRERLFQRLWRWLEMRSRAQRFSIMLGISIVLAVLGRANMLGDTTYRICRIVLPLRIDRIDGRIATPALFLDYVITTDTESRPGRLNDVCLSGETITLSVTASQPCWIAIWGVDRKGLHPLMGASEPVLIKDGVRYEDSFLLDDTEGLEVYYAIGSQFPFRPDQVRQVLVRAQADLDSYKGPAGALQLQLPKEFSHTMIFFRHLHNDP
jgi:hypothetical protein